MKILSLEYIDSNLWEEYIELILRNFMKHMNLWLYFEPVPDHHPIYFFLHAWL